MDPHDGDSPTGLSRRAYLKLAGVTAGLAASGGYALQDADRRANPLPSAHTLSEYGAGPAADRPGSVPLGTRYFASDTGAEYVMTRAGWQASPLSAPRVNAGRVDGVADHVVTTTEELQRAFRTLADGDTVRIAGGVYRPNRWLDVDADDVTILGESRRETLVKPSDGADVGGIRIGVDRQVENVHVAGVGFHGNEATMRDRVKRCHGFVVDRAQNVTIRDCFATRTHPYHEHDAGGSGFTVRRTASDVALVGNYADDIGDRGIQVAGRNVLVRGNVLTNGYDRSISLEVRHPDGRKYYARNVTVAGNLGRDNSEGSVIGASQGWTREEGPGNYAIVGNVAAGEHRRTVFMGIEEGVRNVAIVGNVGRQGRAGEKRSGIYVAGQVSSFVVAGNTLAGYSGHGIEIAGSGAGFSCTGNSVHAPTDDGIHVTTPEGTVANNAVEAAGGAGVHVGSENVTVTGNTVRDAVGHGIHLSSAAGATLASGNAVLRAGETDGRGDGIRVETRDSVVAGNRVVGGRDGIREAGRADGNLYVANSLAGTDPWHVVGPSSQTLGNVPAIDGVREVAPTAGERTVRFDRPYADKPHLEVSTDAAALWTADWQTDGDGNFVGVTLSFEDTTGEPVRSPARIRVHAQQ